MKNSVMFKLQLKKARKEAKLTQEAFADEVGVSIATVQGYEQGKFLPKGKVFARILKVLKSHIGESLSISYLESYYVRRMYDDLGESSELEIFDSPEDFENSWKEGIEKDGPQIKITHNISGEKKYEYIPSKEETLLSHFDKLNNDGKDVAIKRIEELTEIKKYIE